MSKISKKMRFWLIFAAVIVLIAVWLLWGNMALELNTITVHENNLPSAFDGFRIAHISDLHSAQMGKDNRRLIQMLKDAKPDIIAITGDIMDFRDEDTSIAISFAQEATKIAPCYYVTGNHEVRMELTKRQELLDGLEAAGVRVLMDEETVLKRDGEEIAVVGHKWNRKGSVDTISLFDGYRILLSHTPEKFDDYVAADYDLVLCGHNHGGQMRLPFLGGVYAPSEGFFPHFDSGLFSLGNTDMIVSRGIGNSSFPLRINNPPEVVLIVLECVNG